MKEKFKQYYDANKEKFNNKCKKYNEVNKDKLQEKFNCDCGGKYTLAGKSQHIKSLKHKNYIEAKPADEFKSNYYIFD